MNGKQYFRGGRVLWGKPLREINRSGVDDKMIKNH